MIAKFGAGGHPSKSFLRFVKDISMMPAPLRSVPFLSMTALAPIVVALSACAQERPVYVDGAYVRLNANPDNPSSGYFTVHGGSADVTLRSVQTDAAVRVEMHESMMHDNMMHMQPIETVDVPAGSAVAFAPAGKHVMIWKINPQAIAAGKMTFTYIFSNGDRILVDSIIQGPDGKPTGSGPAPTAN